MAFATNEIRDAFEGQSEAGFVAWTYASYDPLEEILQPGYFKGFGRFAPGDLVYVGTQPRPKSSPWTTRHQGKEIRRALLMVRSRDEAGIMRMRLVQDYGRPEDADAAMMQLPKPRGRPKARPE